MHRSTLAAALRCGIATAALIALFSGISSGGASASPVAEPAGRIDVELAFDTTPSMRSAIEQAKRDGASIITRVRDAFPEARFAVVSFRDYGNPGGDYEVLQPMTGDLGALQAAFAGLHLVRNSSRFNTDAEEYNLLFQKSYTDATVGWRSEARKMVFVLGDAEPHGAGAAGIPGCTDTSVDPYGLNTAEVLAGMRAARRTLVMIRQISEGTTAPLQCYEAMAERTYIGGAARNGGETDLARSSVALIQNALAPVTLRPDLDVALTGGSAGYTATVSNPNPFALSLHSLAVSLPAGFRRSGSSTGVQERVLRPFQKASIHLRARVGQRRGRYAAHAAGQLQLPGGNAIISTGDATLQVTPRLKSLIIASRAQRPLRPSGTVSLRGAVRIAFRPGTRKSRAGTLLGGRLVLGTRPGRSLTLRALSHRIVSFGSPTIVRLDLRVENVRGLRGCSPGAPGSATIVDDQRFNGHRLRRDAVAMTFGTKCRIATGRWSNVGGGTGRSAVTTTAR